MLFESKANTIMFFTALTCAILSHAYYTTQEGLYLLFALALFCVLIASIFIIGPRVALDEGTGFLLWTVVELIFYPFALHALVPIGIAITAFFIAHHFKDHTL